jgi:hypothetical protein
MINQSQIALLDFLPTAKYKSKNPKELFPVTASRNRFFEI